MTYDNTEEMVNDKLGEQDKIGFAWYVGATGKDADGKDHNYADEYIAQGIWVNRYDDKFLSVVKSIKVGDKIVLKSAFNQKYNIPYDNNGKKVGAMRIKAIGTVTENMGDGKNIKVEWKKLEPEKDWYGTGCLRKTIHQVNAKDGEIKRKLLAFAFGDYVQEFNVDVSETVESDFESNSDCSLLEKNRMIFGAPGTGKSYKIAREAESIKSFERVTFHTDYTYANFVGTYKPVPVQDNNGADSITYKYVPGPFTRMLVKALSDSEHAHLLIVEEINRANVAAVFGDVFQLLDRDKNGVSEYEIQTSEDMRNYLAEELNVDISEVANIKLPNNLYIWATMNSADQGVYPMDTAFKRRWDFEYIDIDNNDKEISHFWFNVAGKQYHWNSLRKAINDQLTEIGINEDKLMGAFFVSKHIIDSGDNEKFVKAFCNKVIMYLFEDAARQKHSKLFDLGDSKVRYSKLCADFNKKGISVFVTGIVEKYEDFVKGIEPPNDKHPVEESESVAE